MAQVGLQDDLVTATAALVWNGDVPRPVEQSSSSPPTASLLRRPRIPSRGLREKNQLIWLPPNSTAAPTWADEIFGKRRVGVSRRTSWQIVDADYRSASCYNVLHEPSAERPPE